MKKELSKKEQEELDLRIKQLDILKKKILSETMKEINALNDEVKDLKKKRTNKTLCVLVDSVFKQHRDMFVTEKQTFMFIHSFLSKYKPGLFNLNGYEKIEVIVVNQFCKPTGLFKEDILEVMVENIPVIDDSFQNRIRDKAGNIDVKALKLLLDDNNYLKKVTIDLTAPNYDYYIVSDNKSFSNLKFRHDNVTIFKSNLTERQKDHPNYKLILRVDDNKLVQDPNILIYPVEPYFQIMSSIGLLNIDRLNDLPDEFKVHSTHYPYIPDRHKLMHCTHTFSQMWFKVTLFHLFKTMTNYIINYHRLCTLYETLYEAVTTPDMFWLGDNPDVPQDKRSYLITNKDNLVESIDDFARLIQDFLASSTSYVGLHKAVYDYLYNANVDHYSYDESLELERLLVVIGIFSTNKVLGQDSFGDDIYAPITIDLDLVNTIYRRAYGQQYEYYNYSNEKLAYSTLKYVANRMQMDKMLFTSTIPNRVVRIVNFDRGAYLNLVDKVLVGEQKQFEADTIVIEHINTNN